MREITCKVHRRAHRTKLKQMNVFSFSARNTDTHPIVKQVFVVFRLQDPQRGSFSEFVVTLQFTECMQDKGLLRCDAKV